MAYQYYMAIQQPYCWSLLSGLDKQRQAKDEVLCDVRFIMGNSCVYAHRSILALSSGYFQGLLSGSFMESQGEGGTNSRMMEVDMTGCESTIHDLDVLLASIYTGILELTPSNVVGVTELACFLLVEKARDVCETFLTDTLYTHNCLQRLRLAYKYDMKTLLSKCQYFVMNRFHDYFIYQSDMLATPASCLHNMTDIFRHVHLHDMLQFLVMWVDRSCTVWEGVCAAEEKSRRSATACQWLGDTCGKLKKKHLHSISQSQLVGSPDVLKLLLSHCTQGLNYPSNCMSHESKRHSPSGSSDAKQLCLYDEMGESCSQRDADFSDANKNTDSNVCKDGHISESGNESCCEIEDEDSDCDCSLDKGKLGDLSVQGEDRPCGLSKISSTTYEKPSDRSHVAEMSADTKKSSGSTGQDDGSLADTCELMVDKACMTTSDSRPDSITSVEQLYNSDSGHRMSQKRLACTDTQPSCIHKVQKLDDDTLDTSEVLVAFVPDKKSVRHFTATDCEDRPRLSKMEFCVCLYHTRQRKWLWAGSSYFPFKLEDRDAWNVACVNSKAYFLSLRCRSMYMLNLETMEWAPLPCKPLLCDMSFGHKVKSLVPIAVNGKLYVLASDKRPQLQADGSTSFMALQRYFLLDENDMWKPIVDVHHTHAATPLSVVTVSGEKVYVVKATITLNLQKSMLLLQEGHIFDSSKGEVTKFAGTTYTPSPMRMMVRDGRVNIVDSEGLHQQFQMDSQEWKNKGEVNISDIKKHRAVVGESFLPCVSHACASMGSSVWEFCGRPGSLHKSALIELRLNSKDKVFTTRHPPAPFRYVTLMTACQLSSEFVSGLQRCHYLHDDEVDWSEHR